MYPQWQPYVPVAQRRKDAQREMEALSRKGITISPIRIVGRAIATSVWGKAWCTHLERYSDYANRLPRGRTYVRNGSVVDLQISAGKIQARVQGSALYAVTISVTKMGREDWQKLCGSCAGGIDSLVELLQGRLSTAVMAQLCHHTEGMFPSSRQIKLECSCPDDATLCKHLAAVLYGIGARLDHQPELLFLLRQVDASELLNATGVGLTGALPPSASDRVLVADDLSALFGVEMEQGAPATPTAAPIPSTRKRSGKTAAAARAASLPTTSAARSAASTERLAAQVARILRLPAALDKVRMKMKKMKKMRETVEMTKIPKMTKMTKVRKTPRAPKTS